MNNPDSLGLCIACAGRHPLTEAGHLVGAGRLLPHQDGSGATCPTSFEVPWRRGVPDEATVRRHLETPDFDATIAAAFFDVEYLGAFFFRVLATFSHEGALVWGIDLPNDARNEARFVHVAPQGEWYFRPVSITTGGARSWVDAP